MIQSPYLDIDEAAAYLRFTGPRALKSCREWLKANHVPYKRRGQGGRFLVLKAAIDEALIDGWKPTRLRRVGA